MNPHRLNVIYRSSCIHGSPNLVQVEAFSTRNHLAQRPLVLPLCFELWGLGRNDGGTGSSVDHSTIHRWVLQYGPELDNRCRPHLRPTTDSWRVDETYIRVKGAWTYLYRAVDSSGQMLDFLLSAKRDTKAAKRFLKKVLKACHTQVPRVINVDNHAAYPPAVDELKQEEVLSEDTELRPTKYLNNIVEKDHRRIKRLSKPGLGFGSFHTARRTLHSYEAMAMIRKGQIQGINKDDVIGQISFIHEIFGIAA